MTKSGCAMAHPAHPGTTGLPKTELSLTGDLGTKKGTEIENLFLNNIIITQILTTKTIRGL